MKRVSALNHEAWMDRALRLAKRGAGMTSPNPMVGAVLVKNGQLLGSGWHRKAGLPHAEIEAIHDCQRHGLSPQGATLYVTLEPCCTHGRTPPCTDAIVTARIHHVVVGAIDPNPHHRGHGLELLRNASIKITQGIREPESTALNASFNHWIVHQSPRVILKMAMTLDGKIATASGESKWITSLEARADAMRLRYESDAILVGVNTVLADNPSLTVRKSSPSSRLPQPRLQPLRVVLDPRARTPLESRLCTDEHRDRTLVICGKAAARSRVRALQQRVRVLPIELHDGVLPLGAVLQSLGKESILQLLVEGGGKTHSQFLRQRVAHRVVGYVAPTVLGGESALRVVADSIGSSINMTLVESKRIGPDLRWTADFETPMSQGKSDKTL